MKIELSERWMAGKERQTSNMWGIISRTGNLCIGRDSTPFLAYRRKDAEKFRDELIPHIGKGKIVKLEVRYKLV